MKSVPLVVCKLKYVELWRLELCIIGSTREKRLTSFFTFVAEPDLYMSRRWKIRQT